MKRIVSLLCVMWASLAAADEIHLQDGTVLRGQIIQVTADRIEYDPEGARAFDIVPRGQISRIVYSDGSTVLLNETGAVARRSPGTPGAAPVANPGIHRHDGFFLRLMLGAGPFTSTIDDNAGTEYECTGTAVNFRLQAGYAFTDNLILFIDNAASSIEDPEIKMNGVTVQEEGSTIGTSDLGVGASYYFMPYNIFLSASLTMSQTSFEGDYIDGNSDIGWGIHAMAGWEWWISENWGIGAALLFSYSEQKANEELSGLENDITNRYFGIMLSATYN